MRQYTNESQTAKLIELGFEEPKSIRYPQNEEEVDRVDSIDFLISDYSIGELIDFIPDTGNEFMRNRQIFGQGVRFYGERCIYDFDEEDELIDNLFNLVVRLKENGEI